MRWNWELPDWPTFTWEALSLERAEQQFLVNSGLLLGTARHLNREDREQLEIDSMTAEALTTSEIEGEILDRGSVQSSIRKQLGISADTRRVPAAERGVAEMMVSLHRTYDQPLSDEMLFGWQRMLLGNETGTYRTHEDPMQVVSGGARQKVHFEAPPSSRMASEMAAFVSWFNSSHGTLPALTRAGIAHLYFVSIHPFEDGNGRIGRAISDKALAQASGPTFTALAATILAKRKAYYDELESASLSNEITRWLTWFAEIGLEAQLRTIATIDFLIAKTQLFDRLRGTLNERQERALSRMFREGPEGFKGGLSAANYMTITGAPPATATRDLGDLVAKGALVRTGERRHARYFLSLV